MKKTYIEKFPIIGGNLSMFSVPDHKEHIHVLHIEVAWDKATKPLKRKKNLHLISELHNPIRVAEEQTDDFYLLYINNQDKPPKEELEELVFHSEHVLLFNKDNKVEIAFKNLLVAMIYEIQFSPLYHAEFVRDHRLSQFVDIMNEISEDDFSLTLNMYLDCVNRFLASNRWTAYENLHKLIDLMLHDPLLRTYFDGHIRKTYCFNHLRYERLFNGKEIRIPDDEINFIYQLLVYDNWLYRCHFTGLFNDEWDFEPTEQLDFAEESLLIELLDSDYDDDLSSNEKIKYVFEQYVRIPLIRAHNELNAIAKEDFGFSNNNNITIQNNKGIIQIGNHNRADWDKQE